MGDATKSLISAELPLLVLINFLLKSDILVLDMLIWLDADEGKLKFL